MPSLSSLPQTLGRDTTPTLWLIGLHGPNLHHFISLPFKLCSSCSLHSLLQQGVPQVNYLLCQEEQLSLTSFKPATQSFPLVSSSPSLWQLMKNFSQCTLSTQPLLLETSILSPLRLLFSKLNSPSLCSLSSSGTCSQPLIMLVALPSPSLSLPLSHLLFPVSPSFFQ